MKGHIDPTLGKELTLPGIIHALPHSGDVEGILVDDSGTQIVPNRSRGPH